MTRGHPQVGTINPKNGRYLGVPVRWYDWDGSQLCLGSEANICLYMCCTCIKLDTSLHCYLWLCCYAHLFLITYTYIYIHLRVSCSCKEDQGSRACLSKLCASIAPSRRANCSWTSELPHRLTGDSQGRHKKERWAVGRIFWQLLIVGVHHFRIWFAPGWNPYTMVTSSFHGVRICDN
jgi:hypothetical protein